MSKEFPLPNKSGSLFGLIILVFLQIGLELLGLTRVVGAGAIWARQGSVCCFVLVDRRYNRQLAPRRHMKRAYPASLFAPAALFGP